LDSTLAFLTRFSRKVSEAASDADVVPMLADAMVENVGADASAVVRVLGDDVKIVASRNLPHDFDGWRADADELGPEVAARFVEQSKGAFASSRARPMISHGALFGMVVLLFRKKPDAAKLELADALLDIAAVALDHLSQLDELRRAHDELRKTQRALVQAEKLRALGQMASGVAHDLKNILNPLALHVQLVERGAKKGDTSNLASSMQDIRALLARGVQTIERLRDYGQQTREASSAPVDLDHLLEEAATIARPRLAGSKAKVPRIVVEPGGAPPILGRSDEILNAIVNLTINAIDAMKDVGGAVTISTGTADDGCSFVRVSDTGPGMPPDVEARVFEPFFTTKGDQGSGLGLAMVYACMQHHAGTVELKTEVGKGTTFTLRFPAALT
jgi:signal transduction histidine kinase